MKFLISIPILACLLLAGCSNYSANMSTTQGSTAATVDSNPGITSGMAVTSTLTPSDETVGAEAGAAITLSAPALTTGTASTTFSATPASVGAKVQKVLGTVSNISQQLNTGLQAAAPTLETVLSMLHNQGDASILASDTSTANIENTAIQALLTNEQTAIATATATGATQQQKQAAVSQALSPATIAAIIAPIQAATASNS